MHIVNQTFNENVISFKASENMEQENKMTIEEACVNLGYVKKEPKEEFEFAENQYKLALTYENIFGENSNEQENKLDSLIISLDDDTIMKRKTGTIKLEDVKEENENVIQRNIEEIHFETIQCDCCKMCLEKEEHLESHMVHCLKNYNRLSDYLPGFRPTNTGEEEKVCISDEISQSIDVDGSQSIPSTDSKRSSGIDCRAHSKHHFYGDHIGTTHSNINEKEYKCSECCYQTNVKGSLKTHSIIHMDIKPFECDICGKRFTTKSYLKQHIIVKHSNTSEKEYKCSECLYQTNVKSSLKKHLNIHKDIKAFECDICKKGFSHKISLTLHIKNHHSNTSEKEYKCSECSYQTNHKPHFNRHLNTHKNIKPFECDICEKRFTTKSYLKLHIMVIHSNTSEKEYKCSDCPYQTNLKYHLYQHLNTHRDIKPFECDICKKGFYQKGSLKFHIQSKHSNTHKDIRSFECDICKKIFSRNSNLQQHVRKQHSDDSEMEHIKTKHSNINKKEYKCSECCYQTLFKCNLKVHLNTHKDIKLFECDICKKRYSQKVHLKEHIHNKHSHTHNDIKPFECDICKKRFTQKSNLQKHVKNQHSNTIEKEYKCSECSYQTNRKDSLKAHLNTHNDFKAFECDNCKKTFNHKSNLTVHIRKHHL